MQKKKNIIKRFPSVADFFFQRKKYKRKREIKKQSFFFFTVCTKLKGSHKKNIFNIIIKKMKYFC